MSKFNSIEAINTYSSLSDQAKFRLNEVIKIENYFNSEIHERKIMSKKLSKYIAAFNYFDKTLIVLSATSGGVSIFSFASVVRTPAGIASASFTLLFSLTTGIIKKVLQMTRNKKKKHNNCITRNIIAMLAKNKLNNIETLISKALIDLEIGHEEFKTIIKEKEKYERIKEDIRIMENSDELGENNRSIRENRGNVKNYSFFLTCIKCLKSVLKHLLKTVFTT